MAKQLAKQLGYIYIDSGAMYRATTLYAMQHNLVTPQGEILTQQLKEKLPSIRIEFRFNAANQSFETFLNNVNVEHQIRSMKVSSMVSKVSAQRCVRQTIVDILQQFGQEKGIVMDGRDIGTVVFPNAEMKVFVTASPQVRAERRLLELQAKGDNQTTFQDVLKNVLQRDYDDQNRKESPLVQAPDAYVLDNSELSLTQQQEWLLDLYKKIESEL